MSLHRSGSASLVQIHPGALLVSADPLFEIRGDQIMALAARHVVTAIYGLRDYVVTGGLISYAPSLADMYHRVGVYAGKSSTARSRPIPSPATHEIRAGPQSEDCQGSRSDNPPIDPRPRRRNYRIVAGPTLG